MQQKKKVENLIDENHVIVVAKPVGLIDFLYDCS